MNTRHLVILAFIVLISSIVRVWQLGSVPAGPNWDEAAIGYNGWSIWHTRRDEWLEKLPISFKSFGDFKAPLAIYTNGLGTSIFGLNLWTIRLPFAVSGVLAVIGFAVLMTAITQLVPKNTFFLQPNTLILIGTGWLALSPWHILFSRVGFESGLALTELIWATCLLLLSTKKYNNHWYDFCLKSVSIALFASTFYTYHSAKVMVPLFVVMLCIGLHSLKLLTLKQCLGGFFGVIVLIIPFLLDSLFGEGLARASVTIFAQSKSFFETISLLVSNSISHISPSFLLFGKADSVRHSVGNMGVLYPTTLLFVSFGLAHGLYKIFSKHLGSVSKTKLVIWFFAVGWTISGLAPAIIGMEVPHPNRALLALPGFILLAILGVDCLAYNYRKLKIQKICNSPTTLIIIIILVELLQPIVFLRQYFGSYTQKVSSEFQDGYTEMFAEVWSYYDGKDNRPATNQFVITSEYGQPYIYALLTRKISPYQYHNGALINFLFPDVVQLSDLDRPNALVVAGEKSDLIDRSKAVKIIYSKDGRPRFWIFDTTVL